jgi:hypothetical protein
VDPDAQVRAAAPATAASTDAASASRLPALPLLLVVLAERVRDAQVHIVAVDGTRGREAIVLTRARLVRRRDEREQRCRRRIDARSGDLIAGKGLPGLGINDRRTERREVARTCGGRRYRGEDVERRIGVVAVVVEDEAGLRVAFPDAGNLQRAAERERVALLEVLGLVGRLARQRVRRRVERRAGEGHRQEPADLLISDAAAERNPPGPPLAEPAPPQPAGLTAAAVRPGHSPPHPHETTRRRRGRRFRGREAFDEQRRFSCPVAPTLTTDSPAYPW